MTRVIARRCNSRQKGHWKSPKTSMTIGASFDPDARGGIVKGVAACDVATKRSKPKTNKVFLFRKLIVQKVLEDPVAHRARCHVDHGALVGDLSGWRLGHVILMAQENIVVDGRLDHFLVIEVHLLNLLEVRRANRIGHYRFHNAAYGPDRLFF